MVRVLRRGTSLNISSSQSLGAKKGYILAFSMSSVLFAEMLSAALIQTSAGIKIRYMTDRHLFDLDLQRLKANTGVREALI